MKNTVLTITAACLLFSCGCAQTRGNNSTTGAILGGVTGALIAGGNNPATTVLGTLAGALIGSEIGAQMDERDREYATEAFYEASEADVGRVIIWNNPRNGHHGKVIVVRDGRTARGQYCREFKSQVIINGKIRTHYSKACRRPDGMWYVIR